MTLAAPTHLNTTVDPSGSITSKQSSSISPTANSLLIAVVALMNASGTFNVTGVTDTLSGTGSWTVHQQAHGTASNRYSVAIMTAQAGSSPGSGTVTVSWTNNSARTVLSICEITGHSTSAPVPQGAANTGTGNALTVTLGSTPAATSCVVAAVNTGAGNGSVAAGTGFTELVETVSGGSLQSDLQIQYDLASADATADWGTTLATFNNAGVAIEIAEAGGGGGGPAIAAKQHAYRLRRTA
jgi:hypothetical protein